jgi:hypothetical protein
VDQIDLAAACATAAGCIDLIAIAAILPMLPHVLQAAETLAYLVCLCRIRPAAGTLCIVDQIDLAAACATAANRTDHLAMAMAVAWMPTFPHTLHAADILTYFSSPCRLHPASGTFCIVDQIDLAAACATAAGCIDLLAMAMAVAWVWASANVTTTGLGAPEIMPLLMFACNCWQHGVASVAVMQTVGSLEQE